MSIPSGKHNDWPWPFSYIPRSWTAFESESEPSKLIGSADGHLDIPARGTWALTWPPYLAITLPNGLHIRSGLRYDYNDKYYTFVPITIKKIGE